MDDQAQLHENAALAELRTVIKYLEKEVQELRSWRFSAGSAVDKLTQLHTDIVQLTTKLGAIEHHLASIDLKLVELEAERKERERMGIWVRWIVPSGWVLAIFAAILAWWRRD